MATDKRVALVTGGNKGIGLAAVRALAKKGVQVVLGSRNEIRGAAALEQLKKEGLTVTMARLDVTSLDSISSARRQILREFGRLDILVSNAGVMPDRETSILDLTPEHLGEALQTNLLGPLQLAQAVIPDMIEQNYGRIVHVSTTLGLLAEMANPKSPFAGLRCPAYRISKASLNALTALLSCGLSGTNVLVNSLCPGWVKTDMGGPEAPGKPENSGEDIAWLATLPDGGPSGQFFRDRKPVAW